MCRLLAAHVALGFIDEFTLDMIVVLLLEATSHNVLRDYCNSTRDKFSSLPKTANLHTIVMCIKNIKRHSREVRWSALWI